MTMTDRHPDELPESVQTVTPEYVTDWVQHHPLSPIQVDCATAVMLKILDGKCKMYPEEKVVMSYLYDATRTLPGERLDPALHQLIETSRNNLDDDMRLAIYEQRVLAEIMISRPVMKAFKAMIREQGLFGGGHDAD